MIVVDVQALQSPAYSRRGVGRHVADFVATLESEHPGLVDAYAWNDRLVGGPALAALDEELALGARLRSFSQLRGRDVDVLHVPAPFSPLLRADDEANDYVEMAVPVRARRLVVTLHDLIPWRFPERYLAAITDHARYESRLALLLGADALLTVSQSAADDAVALIGADPRRISVIGAGAGPMFTPGLEPHDRTLARIAERVRGLGAGYVAVTAAMDWRKNLDGALAAYARLPAATRAAHQLVVIADLDDAHIADVGAAAGALGIADDVLVPGFVDDALLVDLYRAAELVVVPSRYEGFGLPVVEARACGARVVCSDVTSLPEVLPDARARFDPDDVDAMSTAIRRGLDDPEFRRMLDDVPAAPYDWSLAAQRTTDVYRGFASRGRTRERRKRLAVVTVVPPIASGVADHSERLIAALAADTSNVDVEVYTPGSPIPLRRAPAAKVRHLAALPERFAERAVDRVVYCVGNDPIHRTVFDTMRVVPGAVFLHDVRVARIYGAEGPPPGSRACDSDAGYGATPVVDLATAVLVQSADARDLLREATGREAFDVGPHPCWNAGSSDPIDHDGPPWVVSAGIAHEAKQTDLFVAAMRILADERHIVRGAIVGDGGERFLNEDDAIVATGHVDDAEFDSWLRRASVAVQLRAFSNGESSGVVSHALARGVPLVVTDIGAMRELPEDVAIRVPVDVTPQALATTIGGLLAADDRRAAMRAAALHYAARETPAAQAQRVIDAVFQPTDVRG